VHLRRAAGADGSLQGYDFDLASFLLRSSGKRGRCSSAREAGSGKTIRSSHQSAIIIGVTGITTDLVALSCSGEDSGTQAGARMQEYSCSRHWLQARLAASSTSLRPLAPSARLASGSIRGRACRGWHGKISQRHLDLALSLITSGSGTCVLMRSSRPNALCVSSGDSGRRVASCLYCSEVAQAAVRAALQLTTAANPYRSLSASMSLVTNHLLTSSKASCREDAVLGSTYSRTPALGYIGAQAEGRLIAAPPMSTGNGKLLGCALLDAERHLLGRPTRASR